MPKRSCCWYFKIHLKFKKIAEINASDCTKIIEEIVSKYEIAFYFYDLESNKSIRLPFLIDGIEIILSMSKSIFQSFKDGLLKGKRKMKIKKSLFYKVLYNLMKQWRRYLQLFKF